ncbi:ABC transporter substrate-binding protein [Actinomadura sp. BRA 177]|uniref:ABC transporter substrate-binding protein n=1 Tax=Actinomadura sp. BRA 177 TaxID=2745202 RepID=UPI001595969F|nr:ABC transporter substrate-binding protein [Actinomadura sp. BRA 177]NVI89363.1 ABC transporter substrate-binding protein [Actinomadura sp. BRA 177]
MRRSGRRSSLLAALLLTTSLVAGCGDSGSPDSGGSGPEKETLTVAALPLVDDAGLYIAQKHGLFEAEGIKVRIKPVQQSIQALPALAKGDVDVISAANYVTFLQAHDKGTLKLRILAGAASVTSHMMDVVVTPDSPIRTAKDLEGKKVAVNILNNIQSLTLNEILKAGGADPAKVEYVAIPFPRMAATLQKKQVDAAHMVEPFLTDAKNKLGARVVVDGGGAPVTGLPISGYVSTEDFAAKNPKAAAAFQRAIAKAQGLAAADRKEVDAVVPTYARIDAKTASAITLPGYPTSIDPARLQKVADMMKDAGLLKQPLDVQTVLFQPAS